MMSSIGNSAIFCMETILGISNMMLDLREIILLDSQSTMDLICNPNLVKKIVRSSTEMQLKSNGGFMTVEHKATMAGYHRDVWYDKKAITNILALSNVIKKYRVTYDSDDRMKIVHREVAGKPNMEFRMNENGLHFYDPRDDEFNFVHTVLFPEGFTQRQIKGAELASALYATLSYPSWNGFKWIICSIQIKDCHKIHRHADHKSVVHFRSSFHIWFARDLPVNYFHAIVAIVRDSVLFDNINQGKYVGDGNLVMPHISVITSHCCLVFDRHETTIAFQLHLCAGSEDLPHEC
jgi:hypothetical protein